MTGSPRKEKLPDPTLAGTESRAKRLFYRNIARAIKYISLIMIDADITYMQRCLELARMGRYSARPNPAVGSLIVSNETVTCRRLA